MLMLVTGGAGFIGSVLVNMLLEQGHKVVTLDALTYAGDLMRLQAALEHPNHTFIRGDVCDRLLVSAIFAQGVEGVYHLAAESHVDRSIADGLDFVRTNVLGTATLLEAAKQTRCRFLYVSTDEVYGSLPLNGGLFTEDSPYAPSSPYSASKASGELLTLAYCRTHGLDAVITRCCNNYGPGQHGEKFLPTVIHALREHREIPLYGDGKNVREWIHTRDHCRALMAVFEKGVTGTAYNIGTGAERSNGEMIRMLAKQMKETPILRHVEDRPGHDRRYALDSTRIRRELGWQPEITLEQGLKELVWNC